MDNNRHIGLVNRVYTETRAKKVFRAEEVYCSHGVFRRLRRPDWLEVGWHGD